MLKLDYSPVCKRREDFFSKLTLEQRQKIFEIGDNVNLTPKLIKLKRDRIPVEVNVGDVFIVSNMNGLYLYGKVLQCVNVKHPKYSWSESCFVAFIFKNATKVQNLDNYLPDYNDCISGPNIFDESYWTKGYFKILGNIPMTKEEKRLDIGFFDGNQYGGYFRNAQGKILRHIPKYFDNLGFITYFGISAALSETYITNPELVK